MLDPRITSSLKQIYESLRQEGQLISAEKLADCYSLFRTRFGPEVLAKLEAEELLNFIHARPSKDSLVYWLEFKNDDEFPARFGSIAGGSALKFGVYWRKETGEWTTGSPQNQQSIPTAEAIAIATKQRDQLLAAVNVLEKFPQNAADPDYPKLQEEMNQVAPDVSAYAWGHKYLSLLFPDILDDYHNPDYQKHHLVKILVPPAEQEGAYASAGKLVKVANELGWPMNHLTTVLNRRDGEPIKYWRLGTKLGESADAQDIWPDMKSGGYAAIGWADLGDLSNLLAGDDVREEINKLFASEYSYAANVASRKAGEVKNFAKEVAVNDVILAADGSHIRGVGRVVGDYQYDESAPEDAPHRRQVEWHDCSNWELPVAEGRRTTFVRIKDDVNALIEAEKFLLEPAMKTESVKDLPTTRIGSSDVLKLPSALNTILYGPPGTGKTHHLRNGFMEKLFTDRQAILSDDEQASELVKELAWWEVIALALLDAKANRASVAEILVHPLVEARRKLSTSKNARATIWGTLQMHTKVECETVKYTTRVEPLIFLKDTSSIWSIDSKLVETQLPELGQVLKQFRNPTTEVPEVRRYRFTTFHQSFSYEDFIEGIKPKLEGEADGQIAYEIKDGIFKEICLEALANHPKPYALFIDEINRGNVASIFGELITLIEDDKRIGQKNELLVTLPYSRERFGVPDNLYIIGTMNTADRSVEALDTALRRRFTFAEMKPDHSLVPQPGGLSVDLPKLFSVMNARLEKLLDHDHCIGHAYFMRVASLADLQDVFANKIIPLLREYFYGHPAKIGMVLGEKFISQNDAEIKFAAGDWGLDSLEDKTVFRLTEPSGWTEDDFKSIYA